MIIDHEYLKFFLILPLLHVVVGVDLSLALPISDWPAACNPALSIDTNRERERMQNGADRITQNNIKIYTPTSAVSTCAV